ncbi:hypothetical protein KKQ10_24555 [Pseudomonas sp. MG-9]|uniref:hypothetical protein n=1 Tax=Pseudomonas sp. MG-9 TaxID=2839032 RepID=UPI001BFFDA18|nr:hypothetical protein [Pseudomonas sp. MG-9]MBT9268051.1 hypothetical protein [Pseudomonas sp. MG-9]
MTAIKERPILFSAPMVRAILDGRKTVTRRAIKVQPHIDASGNFCVGSSNYGQDGYGKPVTKHFVNGCCPYGRPGDRLWVRESHAQVFEVDIPHGRYAGPIGTAGSPGKPDWKSRYVYRADGEMPNVQWHHVGDSQPVRWTPSIHMPRAACRILLEITDVRVEWLQDISEDQAKAEGCFFTDYGQECFHGGAGWKDVGVCPAQAGHRQRTGWAWDKTTSHEECLGTPRWAFANLWNATGGDWYANPWVWVVEFKRVQP